MEYYSKEVMDSDWNPIPDEQFHSTKNNNNIGVMCFIHRIIRNDQNYLEILYLSTTMEKYVFHICF